MGEEAGRERLPRVALERIVQVAINFDEWITITEAAIEARVHITKLQRAADRGDLPTTRLGHRRVRIFKRADVQAWIAGQKHFT